MPIPEGLSLRRGDVVLLRAKVEYETPHSSEFVSFVVEGDFRATSVSRKFADLVETVLRIGDEVRAQEAPLSATDAGALRVWPYGIVQAVIDGKAWVEWPLGPSIEPTDKLRRVRTADEVEDLAPRPGEEPASLEELEPEPLHPALVEPRPLESEASLEPIPYSDDAPKVVG